MPELFLSCLSGGINLSFLPSSMLTKIAFILIFSSVCSMAQSQQKKFLALGDSYTIGESVDVSERWPVQLVKALNEDGGDFADPLIIATTGWRTDDLKKAIIDANTSDDFDMVSLLIGVNNQYQGKSAVNYAPEFEDLLKMAIGLAGGDETKVFVVSIPDYGYTPFGKANQEKISEELDEFNSINRKITEKHGARYIYITDISRRGLTDPELVATDGLHPSARMYAEWVARIKTTIQAKSGKKN
jgi:lysophospholipase L1-like esterase